MSTFAAPTRKAPEGTVWHEAPSVAAKNYDAGCGFPQLHIHFLDSGVETTPVEDVPYGLQTRPLSPRLG